MASGAPAGRPTMTVDEIQAALQAERRRVEEQLGLSGAASDMEAVARAAKAAAAKARQAKRKRGEEGAGDDAALAASLQPLRRSSRAAAPFVPYAPTGLVSSADITLGRGGGASLSAGAAAAAAGEPAGPSRVAPVTGALRPETAPQHGSLREYSARIGWMTDTYLGKLVPPTIAGGNQAKASVIFEATDRKPGAPMPRPKFNKYAGLQQYRNAFILFVNIGVVSDSGFTNAFSNGGTTINWFAADSMHEQTPAILRLRHHATGHTYVPDVGGDGEPVTLAPADVALVCRLPGEAYVWCGPVSLQAMDEGSRPLAFTWRLDRAAELAKAPAFQALLKA